MTPQLEVARFLAGATLLQPIREHVDELGCRIVSWQHMNRFGETVEHVTLAGPPVLQPQPEATDP